jgi:hypothetical protein
MIPTEKIRFYFIFFHFCSLVFLYSLDVKVFVPFSLLQNLKVFVPYSLDVKGFVPFSLLQF